MAFLLRDAKRGTRGGKKLAAAVAGRRSRRSRSSVRPNPFEVERWTAQMEIIWNKTSKRPPRFRNRRRQHRVGHNRPAPQWQGFRTPFRMGESKGHRRLAFVMPSLATPKKTARETHAIDSVLLAIVHLALFRCLAVEAA